MMLIIAELLTPSTQVGPLDRVYRRAVIGISHAVLGAALVSSLPAYGLWLALGLAVVYWLAKEHGDLLRGGAWADGAEDTVMVAFGAWYGPWWWPPMLIICAGYIMVMGARR